ncbi:MAG: FAD-dependent oxidoreductase [Steroidobacteraceae bacterium]
MTDHASFSPSRPVPACQTHHWDIEADAVIVGFGAAGGACAIEAARGGARVILLDVASAYGGASALSGGEIYMGGGGGTPIQRAFGFEDSTEDMYQYLLASTGPNADAAKVRLYADNSLEHYRWLTAQGVEYKTSYVAERCVEPLTDDCLIWSGSEEAWPFAQLARPAPRGHCPKYVGLGGGRHIMDVLARHVAEAGVDVRYNARGLALVADHNREVHGVVARIGGEIRFVRAHRAVVLCAGGFIMNRDMVRRHAPHLLRARYPLGTVDDGSGIRLGMSVGGGTINMAEGFTTLPWYPPGSLVKGIFINERGQRFINEDVYHGRVAASALCQGGERIWLLADQSIYEAGQMHAAVGIEIGSAGDTWEEVERELGLPRQALLDTVELYNRHAAQGEDPLFHKSAKWLKPLIEPPYIALDCRIDHCSYSAFTLGGLDTLPTGEVLDEDGAIVPGLFAAGRTACGLPRWGAGYSSGTSLGDATFFGRQAGRRLATTRR